MTGTLPPSAGVIGWPVAHSKSPMIHRFWLGKLGLDGDYGRFPVHPDRLGDAIRALPALGLRGVNVTVPHKVAVMAYLDRADAVAAAVGAVNCVLVADDGLAGTNTDVAGIVESLAGIAFGDAPAIVFGAGGAARAAIVALQQLGAGPITIMNRTVARGAALLADLGQTGDALPLDAPLPAAALVINATTMGMSGQPRLAPDLTRLRAGATVFDMVYAPLETPLLAVARAHGLRTIDGLAMLIGQAAAAFALFYGQPAPRQHDAELRALLIA